MRFSGGPSQRTGAQLVATAAWLLVARIAAAQGDPTVMAASKPGTQVVVKTIAEQVLTGRLSALSLTDGATLVVNGESRDIRTEDLVRITTPEAPWTRSPQDAMLQLADGGAVIGRLAGGDAEAVLIETRDCGRVAVPLEAIAAILTPSAYQEAYRQTWDWLERFRDRPADQDQMLLTNGDVLSGFVNAVTQEGVQFEGVLGETVLAHRVIVAIRMAEVSTERSGGRRVVVTLRSSGRFTATSCQWLDGRVSVRMAHGPDIQIEGERVLSLDFYGGRWEWLSDHQPISFQHMPMLGLDWELALDRNVLGGPLRIGDETFHHGIGVHGRTRLTYDLKGQYQELVTQFGIDDDSGPFADVDVSILVDGQRTFAQFGVRRGRLHGPIRVDISHANRVELVTDFGENGDMQDRFNWIETALVR